MSLHRKLVLYLVGAHLLFVCIALWVFHGEPLTVVALELLLVLSLALGLRLLAKVDDALRHARRFGELLQEQNYAARLHADTGDEFAELVATFNRMLDALYQERIRLGEQRGFLDRLLEATPSAVIVFDFDARISLMNPSALRLLGVADPTDRTLSAWRDGDAPFAADLDAAGRGIALQLIDQLDALQAGDSLLLIDATGRRFRAQRHRFHDRGFPRDFLLVDELTAELEHSEKATYEKLVRVLAHEVNNTVAATGSVLQSLLFYRTQLTDTDGVDFATAIDAVRRRNSRLGEFIERFTRVVKMPDAHPHPTDLRDLVDGVARLYRDPQPQRRITIEWQRRDDIGDIDVDANLLEQALINIVKNAVEAAEATRAERGDAVGHVHLELAREAGRIRLSVIDSGDRLGEVPEGQMFSPFFSTKKGGQGIGLLFAREVFNRHGIAYRLAPDGSGQTRFDLWFPAASSVAETGLIGAVAGTMTSPRDGGDSLPGP